jgi:hypothetical protein
LLPLYGHYWVGAEPGSIDDNAVQDPVSSASSTPGWLTLILSERYPGPDCRTVAGAARDVDLAIKQQDPLSSGPKLDAVGHARLAIRQKTIPALAQCRLAMRCREVPDTVIFHTETSQFYEVTTCSPRI